MPEKKGQLVAQDFLAVSDFHPGADLVTYAADAAASGLVQNWEYYASEVNRAELVEIAQDDIEELIASLTRWSKAIGSLKEES